MVLLCCVSSTGTTSTGALWAPSSYPHVSAFLHSNCMTPEVRMHSTWDPNYVMLSKWRKVDSLFFSLLTKFILDTSLQYTHTHKHTHTHTPLFIWIISHHQQFILHRFNILTVLRITQVPFLKISPHIIITFSIIKIHKADISLQNGSAAMKTILVPFLKTVYSWKPLNNLASYDTVLSTCYIHFVAFRSF